MGGGVKRLKIYDFLLVRKPTTIFPPVFPSWKTGAVVVVNPAEQTWSERSFESLCRQF